MEFPNAAAALFGTNLFGYTQFRLRIRFRGTNKIRLLTINVEGNNF